MRLEYDHGNLRAISHPDHCALWFVNCLRFVGPVQGRKDPGMAGSRHVRCCARNDWCRSPLRRPLPIHFALASRYVASITRFGGGEWIPDAWQSELAPPSFAWSIVAGFVGAYRVGAWLCSLLISDTAGLTKALRTYRS